MKKILLGIVTLLLLVMVMAIPDSSHADNPAAVDQSQIQNQLTSEVGPTGSAGLGPGGVGHTDGSTNLALWLRADSGPFTDAACNSGNEAGANGDLVQCWQDMSGNNADSLQTSSTNRPNYQTGGLNGNPIVRFDGSNDFLNIPLSVISGQTSFSFFTAFNWNASSQWQRLWDFGQNTTINGFITPRRNSSNLPLFAITTSGAGGAQLLTFSNVHPVGSGQITEVIWDGAGNGEGFRNGNAEVANSGYTLTPASLGAITYNYLGRSVYPDPYLNADIGDYIIFNAPLNDTQRILVENYLSSKYNIALSSNDYYDGDTGINGDFDLDVAGIGQFGSNQHTQAHAAGMIVADVDFLQNDGDWLLFGHNVLVNDNTVADLPTTGDWENPPDPQRWLRSFYIDVTDASSNGGNVDIIFDLSEGGMTVPLPAGPANNYRLLKRDNPTGTFEDITVASGATVNVVGDQIQFLGVDVSVLGSNFTVGTLDADNSPTAITLSNIAAQSSSGVNWLVVLMLALALTVSAGYLARKRHTSG